MQRRTRKTPVVGEFHMRGQNSRLAPLRVRWTATESLYYGGDLQVLGGPVGLKARFENRMSDRSWLKNDPNRVAGGRPFTESFYATVAVLLAFADAERLMIECVASPVPLTSSNVRADRSATFRDIEEFDRGERQRSENNPSDPTRLSGTLRAG